MLQRQQHNTRHRLPTCAVVSHHALADAELAGCSALAVAAGAEQPQKFVLIGHSGGVHVGAETTCKCVLDLSLQRLVDILAEYGRTVIDRVSGFAGMAHCAGASPDIISADRDRSALVLRAASQGGGVLVTVQLYRDFHLPRSPSGRAAPVLAGYGVHYRQLLPNVNDYFRATDPRRNDGG